LSCISTPARKAPTPCRAISAAKSSTGSGRAPDLEIIRYDLGNQPVAHLTADAIGALRRAEATTDEQREVGARSDRMIEELQRAD
jgi:FMN-dependent NADH-azoreductase